jgi:hypothetical protein
MVLCGEMVAGKVCQFPVLMVHSTTVGGGVAGCKATLVGSYWVGGEATGTKCVRFMGVINSLGLEHVYEKCMILGD